MKKEGIINSAQKNIRGRLLLCCAAAASGRAITLSLLLSGWRLLSLSLPASTRLPPAEITGRRYRIRDPPRREKEEERSNLRRTPCWPRSANQRARRTSPRRSFRCDAGALLIRAIQAKMNAPASPPLSLRGLY